MEPTGAVNPSGKAKVRTPGVAAKDRLPSLRLRMEAATVWEGRKRRRCEVPGVNVMHRGLPAGVVFVVAWRVVRGCNVVLRRCCGCPGGVGTGGMCPRVRKPWSVWCACYGSRTSLGEACLLGDGGRGYRTPSLCTRPGHRGH